MSSSRLRDAYLTSMGHEHYSVVGRLIFSPQKQMNKFTLRLRRASIHFHFVLVFTNINFVEVSRLKVSPRFTSSMRFSITAIFDYSATVSRTNADPPSHVCVKVLTTTPPICRLMKAINILLRDAVSLSIPALSASRHPWVNLPQSAANAHICSPAA